MQLSAIIRRSLAERGIHQRDLAAAADVTESYISQLLSGKKAPPAPSRSDVYKKIAKLLSVPEETLVKVANAERQENLKRRVTYPPRPLFAEFRDLILRKCAPAKRHEITEIFGRETFGVFERLITQKLLELSKQATRVGLTEDDWIRRVAKLARRGHAATRASIMQFLETGLLNINSENCVSLIEPLIRKWDIDLESFRMTVVLNRQLVSRPVRELDFREEHADEPSAMERGLSEFLQDEKLCAGISAQEIDFLKRLQFHDHRPSQLYFYRELQNLRDPLNFIREPPREARSARQIARVGGDGVVTADRPTKRRVQS